MQVSQCEGAIFANLAKGHDRSWWGHIDFFLMDAPILKFYLKKKKVKLLILNATIDHVQYGKFILILNLAKVYI